MNIKPCYLYFAIASAVAVILRALMLFFAIDSQSGFIKDEYSIIATVIFVSIATAAVLSFFFAYSARAASTEKTPNSLSFKLASVGLAAFILYDTLFSASIHGMASVFKAVELVCAILAAVSLISFVITDYMKIEFPIILSVTPVFFWFVRLIIVFTSFSTLANIPDNLFELASICLLLVSSLQASKSVCIPISEKTSRTNFALFLTTSFVCFVTALPRAIISVAGNSELLHTNDLPILTTLIAGVYFLIFAINGYKQKA